ncbi:MAG TPA: glycosyltransferase family 2 protein [Vicinamibacteria bacterium]|nr:glycosyltransferase family 2 protein [Vicinamibacteria bacterium]
MVTPPTLSIVLPVFNEEAGLMELHRRLVGTLETMGESFELLYVDDGSADQTLRLLRDVASQDKRVVVLALSRNFGHQIALTAGLDHGRGEAIVTMDSDLQDPPELLPDLVARWREGYDVVYARRRARPGETAFKRGSAFLFYRALRMLTRIDIPTDTGDFRLLSRKAAEALRSLPEQQRFLRGLVAWIGFRQVSVDYDRPARKSGESKYRLRDMMRLAKAAAFGFSSLPIGLLGLAGAVVSVGAIVAVLLTDTPALVGSIFFLGGVQLLGMWVIGEYVATIASEVRRRPLYVVREAMNLPSIPASDA